MKKTAVVILGNLRNSAFPLKANRPALPSTCMFSQSISRQQASNDMQGCRAAKLQWFLLWKTLKDNVKLNISMRKRAHNLWTLPWNMFSLALTDQQCLFGMGHDAAYTLTLASQPCHSDHDSVMFHSSFTPVFTPNLKYPQINTQYNTV